MAGSSRPIQYSIDREYKLYGGNYIYRCNGCGTLVKGYYKSVVYGNVWCMDCTRKRRKEYAYRYWKKKLKEVE